MQNEQQYNRDLAEIIELVIQDIERARSAREPYSLIRLGDGEGYILGYPDETTHAEVENIFRIWFGNRRPDLSAAVVFRDRLLDAVKNANVLGVATKVRQEHWKRSYRILDNLNLLEDKLIVPTDIHLSLHDVDGFKRIIHGERSIGLLTCRDISRSFMKNFGVEEIVWVSVPEEAQYADPSLQISIHYPDVFEEICLNLRPDYKGQIWLVGAGILGKFYCSIIKNRGGIAIDIGSVFDSWAEMTRRGSVKNHRIGF